jgi:hypothetical protein
LRRRRRHSTLLFKTDTNPTLYSRSRRSKKKWLRNILYFVLLCLIGLVAFYVYETYYFPAVPPSRPSASGTGTAQPGLATDRQPDNTMETPAAALAEKKIQVEILNGCGKDGIAKVFQVYLQDKGYDVVNTDNYIENGKRRWDVPESMVINQTGKTGAAQQLARDLGISTGKIVTKPNPNAIYDLSIVLGRDYTILKAMSQNR